VKWQEVLDGNFVECGLCGTAAVISPVGHIEDGDTVVEFPDGLETSGPVMKKLRATLTDIQQCKVEGPEGWVVKVL
jgi:branched-chain amino acid aminotransferase